MANEMRPPSGLSDLADNLYPGQWRLARVEVVNWGTFGGHHVLPVDRRGMLITGDSGSGKSTLLDAVATVLTPPANLNLNAAANNGNARDSGRSISNYVRGAIGNAENRDGEIVHSFLRERVATWSGVLLCYEDGVSVDGMPPSEARKHEPVNLLAVFFQKANSSSHDGLKRFYAVVRGERGLLDFQDYGMHEADLSAFNKDFQGSGKAWRKHSDFESHVCNRLHIESAKTLVLLHKTQAAKNIGSLDNLFRTYMLDEPRTFDLARAAVDQFGELSEAHGRVVDQRNQLTCLGPIAECDEAYAAAEGRRQAAEMLGASLVPFTEGKAISLLEAELERMRRRGSELEDELERAEAEQRLARQEHAAAAAALHEKGGIVLEGARKDVDIARQHLEAVEASRSSLERDLSSFERFSVPDTREEFETLVRALSQEAQLAREQVVRSEAEKIDSFAARKKFADRERELRDELRFLRMKQSNIPRKLDAVRMDIVRHLGITPEDAPFLGELVDVKPEWAEWQGAIERLVGGSARTMLVAQRHARAINEYLEARHLGMRFDYDGVPDDVEVPPLPDNPASLVRRVSVKQLEGREQLSRWVHKTLRQRFDYVCVDRPGDLERHERAITRGGQVKQRNHHMKDDRFAIDDKTRWVLGSTNDDKIALLEGELSECRRMHEEAKRAGEVFARAEREADALERLSADMAGKEWRHYNAVQAEADLASARGFCDKLANSDAFKQLNDQHRRAEERRDAADAAVEAARVKTRLNEDGIEKAARELDSHKARLDKHAVADGTDGSIAEAVRVELEALLRQALKETDATVESLYQAMQEVSDSLSKRREKAERDMHAAEREAVRAMERYRTTWTSEASDLSSDFSDREAYLARLRQIKATRLPEFEQRFLDVLTSFSQDQITVIASEIRGAFREVRERLEPVNRSLRLSEYEPGVFLQIEVTEHRSQKAKDFLSDLAAVTSGSWENDDLAAAELRFARTNEIMKRLGSSEPADAAWRRHVLDTTMHMRFTAKEVSESGAVLNVHSNDGGLSGGQKQKLVFFCLAAALRYQLADEDQPVPAYGTVILDEAFDKSDRHFAADTLAIFEKFGFHMVLATPGKLLQAVEDHIGSIVVVTCEDHRRSSLSPVMFETLDAHDAAVEDDGGKAVVGDGRR